MHLDSMAYYEPHCYECSPGAEWSGKFIPWAKEAFARDMGSGMPLKCEPDDPANVAKRKLENHRGLLPDVTNSLYRNSYVDHKGGMKIPGVLSRTPRGSCSQLNMHFCGHRKDPCCRFSSGFSIVYRRD